ncbi:MAG: pyrroloquinoline quinone biosynthesis protein PqqE, partial [Acetobacter fabarum]
MSAPPPPMSRLAALTPRCPREWPYCSNPLLLAPSTPELG